MGEVGVEAETDAAVGGLLLFAAQYAEDDPMEDVGEDERGAEEEESEEPTVPDVNDFVHSNFSFSRTNCFGEMVRGTGVVGRADGLE